MGQVFWDPLVTSQEGINVPQAPLSSKVWLLFSYRRMIQLVAYPSHHLAEIRQLVENSKGQSFNALVSHEEGNNNVSI